MEINTIIDRLLAAGCTLEGAFGVLGNLYAESGLQCNNLENSYARAWGITDDEYTSQVDDGQRSRESFRGDSAGYGLAQWTYYSRKDGLWASTVGKGKSISDEEGQMDYLIYELKTFGDVWDVITQSHDLKECSDIVLVDFERPADQSEANKQRRYEICKRLLEDYSPETPREQIVKTASYYVGCVQYDERHRRIIDIYNSHLPRARGYKMSYSDDWCAAFASGVFIEAGYADYFPLEVGCGWMMRNAKEMGIWVEDNDYVPSIGDGIMYDFDGGDDDEDHVGLVAYVGDGRIHTIEGNMGNGYCGTRTLQIGDKWIRGFIHVHLPDDPTPPTPPTPPQPKECEVKLTVLGIGDEGYEVESIQALLQDKWKYDLEYCGGCDGIFGEGTEYAVKAFQKKVGITVDGVVGEDTWNALLKE